MFFGLLYFVLYLSPMANKETEYSGIWMKVGCFLSALAILGIITVIALFAFNLLSGL